MKLISKLAWNTAKNSANNACPWLLYARKLPDKVKKLRKF